MYSRYTAAKCAENYIQYSTARRNFKNYQNLLYQQHIRNTQAKLKKDPSSFWEYANSKKKSSGYPAVMFR